MRTNIVNIYICSNICCFWIKCVIINTNPMPEVCDIIVAVLSSLAVIVNSLGALSVARSYKRLRQRMYMFVISLTAANVVVGISFLGDVTIKFIYNQNQHGITNNQSDCSWRTRDWAIVTESLKSSSIVLSALNIIILTYALYMRTTRMGRHRTDSYSTTAATSESGGNMHLPAFDTMLRVLSLGPAAEKESEKTKKILPRKANSIRFDTPPRHDEDSLLPRPTSRRVSLTTQYIDKKNSNKFASMLSLKTNMKSRSGLRFSRSSDGYVGRHGVSVVSYRVSVCLIVGVWISFVALWVTPTIISFFLDHDRIKSSFLNHLICPSDCIEQFQSYIQINDDSSTRSVDTKKINQTIFSMKNKTKENNNSFNCIICSVFYFPMTKIQTALSASIIIITWFLMLYSSLRLLWLRKHSNNVFVRCSALWRFILLTAIFHIVALLPHVVLSFVDTINGNLNDVTHSNSYTRTYSTSTVYSNSTASLVQPVQKMNETTYNQTEIMMEGEDKRLQLTCINSPRVNLYLSLSSTLLLFHSTVSPLMYLLRLLGCRRLFSFR